MNPIKWADSVSERRAASAEKVRLYEAAIEFLAFTKTVTGASPFGDDGTAHHATIAMIAELFDKQFETVVFDIVKLRDEDNSK